jgi:hypothetical protein
MKQDLTAIFNRTSKILLTSLFHYFDNFQISLSAFCAGPPDKLAEVFDFM